MSDLPPQTHSNLTLDNLEPRMLNPTWPLDQGLPTHLPWTGSVGLLLDGVSVKNLPRQLHQWSASPTFEPLYLCTRWAEVADISPCLIRIQEQDDPILQQFLLNVRKEWGYLLFSDAPWPQMVEHLRWLTSVRHPHGAEVLLRLADPAVAHALLSDSEHTHDPCLFGPCSHILTADAALEQWHLHQRPEQTAVPNHSQPYRLSEEQLSQLDAVSFRAVLMRLDQHMRTHFPRYCHPSSTQQRWQHLQQLAAQAYERGYHSEFEIMLYANIHGFLGERALEAHPDLDALLNTPSPFTPAQRLEQAADTAMHRAESLPGSQG